MSEIVRPYNKEERKKWFAIKRREIKVNNIREYRSYRSQKEKDRPITEEDLSERYEACRNIRHYSQYTEEKEKEIDDMEANGKNL